MDESERDDPVPTADRWEYNVVRPPREGTKKEARDPSEQLAGLGERGWELTETIEYVGGGTKYFVFKRPASVGAEK